MIDGVVQRVEAIEQALAANPTDLVSPAWSALDGVSITGTSGAPQTVFTGPPLATVILVSVGVCNTSGSAADLTAHIASSASTSNANTVIAGLTIGAGQTVMLAALEKRVLAPAVSLVVHASASGALQIFGTLMIKTRRTP